MYTIGATLGGSALPNMKEARNTGGSRWRSVATDERSLRAALRAALSSTCIILAGLRGRSSGRACRTSGSNTPVGRTRVVHADAGTQAAALLGIHAPSRELVFIALYCNAADAGRKGRPKVTIHSDQGITVSAATAGLAVGGCSTLVAGRRVLFSGHDRGGAI
jgi:hypothetical protein